MKKILIVVAIVLCLAVAGAALAVSYNSATPVTGSLVADQYIKLSLDECSEDDITINPGTPVIYTIQCDMIRSATVTNTGTLTITLTDGDTQDLDDVTVALFEDFACTRPIEGKSITGANTLTITGIDAEETIIYARISVPSTLGQGDCEDCGGTMTLSFVKA